MLITFNGKAMVLVILSHLSNAERKKKKVSSVLTIRWRSVTNGAERMKPLQQKTLSRVKKLLQKRLNARKKKKPRPSEKP